MSSCLAGHPSKNPSNLGMPPSGQLRSFHPTPSPPAASRACTVFSCMESADSLSRDLPGSLRIYALATPGPPAMGPKLAEAFLYYFSFLAWPSPHLTLGQVSFVELAFDLPISCGVSAPRNMQSFRDVPFPGPKLNNDGGFCYGECYQNRTCGKWPRFSQTPSSPKGSI